MFSIYTEALLRFFAQIQWNGVSVPVVNAGPDRAHARIQEWLLENRGIEYKLASGENVKPCPFMALWSSVFKPVPELQNPGMIRDLISTESGYGYAIRNPKSVSSTVDVNIYLDTLTQRDNIIYQLYCLFPEGVAYIPIDYGDPRWYLPPNEAFAFAQIFGKTFLLLRMDNLTDQSALENSGLNGRSVRLTWSGELYGWIPFQPYAVPLAMSTHIELVEKSSNEVVAQVVYGSEV